MICGKVVVGWGVLGWWCWGGAADGFGVEGGVHDPEWRVGGDGAGGWGFGWWRGGAGGVVNGEGEPVVRDAAAFQRAVDADTLEAIRCIREGLEQAKRGEGVAADEFFRAFRAKYGLAAPAE